ncbi:MAG: amidohydrolase family protein [Deltaproteobacteria bacterium]|nr:amidohydrolase family protein [Deltaproteobacteria bacterium]
MAIKIELDLRLKNANIHDGTGRQPFKADLGVVEDKIAAIGDLSEADAKESIDLKGLALCPGFIDIHTHVDLTAYKDDHEKLLEPLVRQGVTTVVGGNCGVAMAPVSKENRDFQMAFYDFFIGAPQENVIKWKTMDGFLSHLEKQGVVLNIGVLVPHGMLRIDALGSRNVLADQVALKKMRNLLEESMEAGALGMSTGLQYFPALASDSNELEGLAKVVSRHNGIFTAHLRSYNSDTLDLAVEEVVSVGRKAEVPVQVSHLFWIPNFGDRLNPLFMRFVKAGSKLYNMHHFPLPVDAGAKPILEKVDKLRSRGYPVGVDAMPTAAGFTHMLAAFPPWALEGTRDDILGRLKDKTQRKRIRETIEKGQAKWPHRGPSEWSMNFFKTLGWDGIYIMSVVSGKNQGLVGKNLVQIGKERGKHPFDVACDLLIEEQGRVLIFETATFPGDPLIELSLASTLKNPNVSIVTDSILLGYGMPSHLFYDCYPKFLSQYCGEGKDLELREGIRKCTYLPATQAGIERRGKVATGWYADLVAFDPERLKSNSTASNPMHWPNGIEMVIVNGKIVKDENGYHPGGRPGKVLRRGAF